MASGLFSLEGLVRPNIWRLKPYRCARDDYADGVLLDANENSFGPPMAGQQGMERYPCPYQWELRGRVAELRGVEREQVFVGVGSDEAIDMLIRIFCTPGQDKLMVCSPTYGMYSVSADTNDVQVVDVPLTSEFQLDIDKVLSAVAEDPAIKLLFACSPGNPTCVQLSKEHLIRILDSGYRGMLVVDEAYVDFAGPEASMSRLVSQYPQMVVLQTMSKAFGLAGIRCGFALGDAEMIAIMNKVKAPYNLNKLTSKVALEAFDHLETFQQNIQLVLEEKEKLRAALEGLGGIVKRVLPSDTNFLMFEVDRAEELYKTMADGGVVVRYRGNCLHCDGCLRVTVGTPAENEQFLVALKKAHAGLN